MSKDLNRPVARCVMFLKELNRGVTTSNDYRCHACLQEFGMGEK